LKKIVIGAIVISLATTPWVSSDALIIPKIIILTCLAAFLLPSLFKNYKLFLVNKNVKTLLTFSMLFITHMILVMIISNAPFEQEFFGVTGRGLGFITYFSLIVLMLYTAIHIKNSDVPKVFYGLLIACSLSSIYSIFQFFNIDFSDWRTQTNGIIGTIGNPNFQSSFIAVAFVPTMVYLWSKRYKYFLISFFSSILLFTLYICESTQGYIALSAAIACFILAYLFYQKSKTIFVVTLVSTVFAGLVAIAGMLNKGPLSYYLYKVSVRSRGEMWQTVSEMIRNNPTFGVGLDSLGDYSLMYQNEKTANGIAEYIDNSHNFLLQFAATGGILLALYYLLIILLTLFCFFIVQKRIGKFDRNLAALFAAWISFQMQSFISPAAIPTLVWNFIICGIFVGLSKSMSPSTESIEKNLMKKSSNQQKISLNASGIVSVVLAFFLTFPLFNADRLARQADTKKDALLAVRAAKTYPESVVRYNRLGAGLFGARLYDLSLDIGRSAVEFNPNSYQTWILILLNPSATIEERSKAKEALMLIDPNNKVIKNYKF
jgi:O-antigen ligase